MLGVSSDGCQHHSFFFSVPRRYANLCLVKTAVSVSHSEAGFGSHLVILGHGFDRKGLVLDDSQEI